MADIITVILLIAGVGVLVGSWAWSIVSERIRTRRRIARRAGLRR